MKKPRIAVVEWIDSSMQNGQVDKEGYPKPEIICSAGWLIEETEEHVTLARDDMARENPGDFRGLLAIPRECVRAFFLADHLAASEPAPRVESPVPWGSLSAPPNKGEK